MNIPGDISSAAFFIVLTLLAKDSIIKIKKINLNSTRDGIIKILKKMNAKIKLMNIKTECGEKVGDIVVKSSSLKSVKCPSSLVPILIDEFPILMIAAAKAKGVSNFPNLLELNTKESPRLNLMNKILNQVGVKTKLNKGKIKIFGNPNLNLKNKSYKVNSMSDHRIVMACVSMALTFGGKIKISGCDSIATSFPNFLKIIRHIGGKNIYEIQ